MDAFLAASVSICIAILPRLCIAIFDITSEFWCLTYLFRHFFHTGARARANFFENPHISSSYWLNRFYRIASRENRYVAVINFYTYLPTDRKQKGLP